MLEKIRGFETRILDREPTPEEITAACEVDEDDIKPEVTKRKRKKTPLHKNYPLTKRWRSGLTPSQIEILKLLSGGEPMTWAMLLSVSDLTMSSIRGCVGPIKPHKLQMQKHSNSLVALGLVSYCTIPDDDGMKSIRAVMITEDGEKTLSMILDRQMPIRGFDTR